MDWCGTGDMEKGSLLAWIGRYRRERRRGEGPGVREQKIQMWITTLVGQEHYTLDKGSVDVKTTSILYCKVGQLSSLHHSKGREGRGGGWGGRGGYGVGCVERGRFGERRQTKDWCANTAQEEKLRLKPWGDNKKRKALHVQYLAFCSVVLVQTVPRDVTPFPNIGVRLLTADSCVLAVLWLLSGGRR